MTRYRNAALAWAGTAAWMCLIYWASGQSDMRAVPLVRRFGLLPWTLSPAAAGVLEWVLRKGAHLATYAVLVLLASAAIRATWPKSPAGQAARWGWVLAVAYAVTDEWHQSLVPGRDGWWLDVVIDGVGAALALWFTARRRHRPTPNQPGDVPAPDHAPAADPGRRLLRIGAALTVVSLANRLASYAREATLAYSLGASAAADQYAVAYTLATVLGIVLGSAFGVVLVPQLVQREAAGDRAGMRLLVARFGGAVLLVSIAAALAMGWLEPPAWAALGPAGRWNWWGFAAGLPAGALFTLYGFVLNARDRFVAPLALPILLDAIIVAGFAGAARLLGVGALGVSYAAGSLVLAAVVAVQAAGRRAFALPDLSGWRTVPWLLVLPALITSAAPALLPVLGRTLAVSLVPGDAAVLHYALLLAAVPAGLLAQPAAHLLLPYLSRAALGQADLFRREAAGGLTAVLVLALPAAAGLAVLAEPIVRLLFGRGALDPDAAARVAQALVASTPGLIGMTAFSVVQQGWYARQTTWVPLYVSLLGLAAGAGTAALLRPALGYIGLALGVSAGNVVAGGVLVGLLQRQLGGALDAGLLRLLARSAVAAAVMAAAVSAWRHAAAARPDTVTVAGGIGLGVAVYGVVLLGPAVFRLRKDRVARR